MNVEASASTIQKINSVFVRVEGLVKLAKKPLVDYSASHTFCCLLMVYFGNVFALFAGGHKIRSRRETCSGVLTVDDQL